MKNPTGTFPCSTYFCIRKFKLTKKMGTMSRKVLIVLGYLLCATFASGQVAIKTNVPLDVVRIPNLGFEVGLGKKFTLDVPFY